MFVDRDVRSVGHRSQVQRFVAIFGILVDDDNSLFDGILYYGA